MEKNRRRSERKKDVHGLQSAWIENCSRNAWFQLPLQTRDVQKETG